MDNCIIEIIFILNKNASIGRTPESFSKILEATDEIKIDKNVLSYSNIDFTCSISEHGTRKDSLFIRLELKSVTDDNLSKFSKLLRTLKKISAESNLGNIQIVWDDISKIHAIKAYPLIHEIENLMRKLITKFMLHNLGLAWTKTSIPEELKREINSSSKQNDQELNNEHNIMYQVDFIQLSNFLFNAYRELEIAELIRKIAPLSFDDMNENTFIEIKKIIPKTNWEKYFEASIDITSDVIKKDWRTLYDLRCKIAHNRDFTKRNLDDVVSLTTKLKPILNKAISKTENIEIDVKDKSELASQFEENFIENTKSDVEIYVDSVIDLYQKIRKLYKLAYSEETSGKKVGEIVRKVFDFVLADSKYQSSDVSRLMGIAFDKNNIYKYDNFELDELGHECKSIKEVVDSKIIDIEIQLDGPDSYE